MAENNIIKLFKHNAEAYISATLMLKETDKAAVIYPAGMGKSFIAFVALISCENSAEKNMPSLSK